MAKAEASNKIIIGPFRASYAFIWTPRPLKADDPPDKKPMYGVKCLIPKTDTATLAKLRAAIETARKLGLQKYEEGWGKKLNFKEPLRDADAEESEDPADKGCMFVNANSALMPGIVDRARQPIVDKTEIYSGVWLYAEISVYPYKHKSGGRGIAVALNHIMKYKDDEPLAGRGSAEDAFATLEVADTDDPDF